MNFSRPCGACGKPIGGGYKHCPQCNIYLCLTCRLTLTKITNEFSAKCPICGKEMGW